FTCLSCLPGHFFAHVRRLGSWLPNNLPFSRVATVCLDGGQPAPLDQNFGRVDRPLPISGGVWSIATDIPRGESVLRPIIPDPVQKFFCRGTIPVPLFARRVRPPPIQSFK